MAKIRIRTWMVGLMFCGLGLGAFAEQGGIRATLSETMRSKQGDSAAWEALLRDGADRAHFCAYCHGKDGNSVMPLVPNLAGQNPFYLLEQIGKFADGRRQDYIMTPLARRFSAKDKVALVLYYAAMRPKNAVVNAAAVRGGETRYRDRCVVCHGPDAHGGERYARLAGQRAEYLKHRLYSFKRSDAARFAPVMAGIAKMLKDDDIEPLAAYLASLP